MITILGIDPGYGTIGYGVVRFDNMKFTPVQYGAAKTAPGTPMHLRLCEIYDDICTLVDTFHPDEVAIEELFFSKNVTTGIQVAQARGVILLALAQKGLHPVSYTPNQVKLSVVGYGGAEEKTGDGNDEKHSPSHQAAASGRCRGCACAGHLPRAFPAGHAL